MTCEGLRQYVRRVSRSWVSKLWEGVKLGQGVHNRGRGKTRRRAGALSSLL